jgi:hypothetical protein
MSTPTFHLYLDDSGTRYPNHKHIARDDSLDYFALGGLLIPSECVERAVSAHSELMSQYDISGPLHSNSIRVRKGAFAWLEHNPKKAACFYIDLERMLCKLPGNATGCIVHRPGYNARYTVPYGTARWDLCKSAYSIVVEHAAKFSARFGRRLQVYVEETGKKEDQAIKKYHTDMRTTGMYLIFLIPQNTPHLMRRSLKRYYLNSQTSPENVTP